MQKEMCHAIRNLSAAKIGLIEGNEKYTHIGHTSADDTRHETDCDPKLAFIQIVLRKLFESCHLERVSYSCANMEVIRDDTF